MSELVVFVAGNLLTITLLWQGYAWHCEGDHGGVLKGWVKSNHIFIGRVALLGLMLLLPFERPTSTAEVFDSLGVHGFVPLIFWIVGVASVPIELLYLFVCWCIATYGDWQDSKRKSAN